MMKTLPLVAALLAAGLVGGLVATLVASQDVAPEVSSDGTELLKIAAQLQDVSGRLARVEELALRPEPLVDPLKSAPSATAESLLEPTPADSAALNSDKLDERVRAAIEENREEEASAMGRRMQTMFEQRDNTMLAGFAEEQGLTPYERERMNEILSRRRQAFGEFFRVFRGGGEPGADVDMATIRQKVTDVRNEADEQIRDLLSPDQYEAFQAVDQVRGPGWMGGGGRGSGSGGRDR